MDYIPCEPCQQNPGRNIRVTVTIEIKFYPCISLASTAVHINHETSTQGFDPGWVRKTGISNQSKRFDESAF